LEQNSSSLVTDIHRSQSHTFASPPSPPPPPLFNLFLCKFLCANLAVRERKRNKEVGREESKGPRDLQQQMAMMALNVTAAGVGAVAVRSFPSQSAGAARNEQSKAAASAMPVGRIRRRRREGGCMRLQAQPSNQQYVDYAGNQSVFPAEACEELGGDSCAAEGVGPEVKLNPTTPPKPASAAQKKQQPDREYVDYESGNKTVFPGEACDELGGEFCEGDYQKDVFPEKS
jgi:hypothetical protein